MKLSEMKAKVFSEKPAFASFYETWAEKTWSEYIAATFPLRKILTKENLELIDHVEAHLTPLLGVEKARVARKTLEENFFASTAEHHGVLNHPFFLNSALARSQKNTNVVVLAFGGISLSNSSFPRGMAFHDEQLELVQVPFISHKYRSEPLFSHQALEKKELSQWFDKLSSKIGAESVGKKKLLKLKQVGESFLDVSERPKLFALKTASEQFTVLNNKLWNSLFDNSRGELFYIEIETLVAGLLSARHFNRGTIIEKIIFDEVYRRAYLTHFDGVDGAHDSAKGKGSHLFWYIDTEKHEREQIFVNGNFLETARGIKIALEQKNIERLLVEKKLMPTMALSFLVVSFYHGLTCGGGFSQVGYLGDMKRAYDRVVAGTTLKTSDVRTNMFSGEFVLATLRHNEKTVSANFLDLFLYGGEAISERIDELLSKIPIKDTLDHMMPELYKIVVGGHNRVEADDLPAIPSLMTTIPENTVESKKPKEAKKPAQKCPYCGNNPVNHFYNFWVSILDIPLKPFSRLGVMAERSFLRFLSKYCFMLTAFALQLIGVLKYGKEKTKAVSKRSEVIWEEAERRGIAMEQLVICGRPIEYYRAKIHGTWHYFESLPVPGSYTDESYEWMDDKIKLKKKFLAEKIPVARGGSVWDSKTALNIFNSIDKPVITKPRFGSRGRHTTTQIHTEEDVLKAFAIAKQLGIFVVIEEHLVGSVYRATYVGGEIAGILRGDPPRITGTGEHTIRELIEIKNKQKPKNVKDVLITPLLVEFLARTSWRLDDVLPAGKEIDLSEKIGISYGGFSVEELPKAHPKLIAYLKRAGDILNAPVVGFDFIIGDVAIDPDTQKWGIIEANSLPFINLHHFPLEGEPINVAAKVWDLWSKTA